jgi:hypothetical protein
MLYLSADAPLVVLRLNSVAAWQPTTVGRDGQ